MSRSLVALLALAALALPARAQDLAIRAKTLVVDADQAPVQDGVVLIKDGKVVAAGAKVEVPAGLTVLERKQAWVVPGFVDLRAHLGLQNDLDERAEPFANDVDLSRRINANHRDYRAHLAAGITTCLLSPGDAAILSGAGVAIKTTGKALGDARVAKLSLSGQAAAAGPPTSISGRLALFRERLREAHAAGRGEGFFGDFARGDVPGLVTVDAAGAFNALRRLEPRYGLRVVYDLRIGITARTLEGLEVKGAVFAFPPSSVTANPIQRRQAALLAKAGASLAFVSFSPAAPAEGMRLAAVQAAKGGLGGQAALAGLTSVPAKALGLEGQVGTLKPGADGDFLVLSGPPLDLRTRVLEVYVDGRRAHRQGQE